MFRREDKTNGQGRFADLCWSTYKRKVSRHDMGANRGDLGTQHEKKTVIKETSWQTISDKRVIWQTEHFIESWYREYREAKD